MTLVATRLSARLALAALLALSLACMRPINLPPPAAPAAASAPGAAPVRYQDGKLLVPSDYRNWVFLTSGLDMSYSAAALEMGHSMFDNVFADPASFGAFLATGSWPEGAVLVKEVRLAASKGSINQRGHFQARQVMGMEVHIKDSARFASTGGWGFFEFESEAPTALIPASADCYSCHREHGVVDNTFVQYYPTLLAVAEAKGTARTEAAPREAGGGH
jgi:hypothetical protein